MNNVTNRKECECDDCGEHKLCSLQHNGKMWMCNDCVHKEKVAMENTTIVNMPTTEAERLARYEANPFGNKPKGIPEGAMSSISVNEILNKTGSQDTRIQVRTDMFNAKTQAIVELKAQIDADDSITNKPYALAEALKNRFQEVKTVVFDLNEKLVEAGNEQRAIQVYLNVLANQLRAEEREKLKLQDINYKPAPAKIAKPKTVTTTGTGTKKQPKVDKVALRKAAASLGIAEFTFHMVMNAKGWTIDEAVTHFKALQNK